jgi:hypothetical protein
MINYINMLTLLYSEALVNYISNIISGIITNEGNKIVSADLTK